MAAIWEPSFDRAERENWGYRASRCNTCAKPKTKIGGNGASLGCSKSADCPMAKASATWMRSCCRPKSDACCPACWRVRFVERAENVLAFGLPGRGKTHFLAAVGRELILRAPLSGALYVRPSNWCSSCWRPRRTCAWRASSSTWIAIPVVILDDIGYVQQDREEMEVLFTFLAERYERRSVMISSNLVFSKWDQIFKDPMTTMAAIDRLVHHALILEFNGESVRAQKCPTAPKPNRPSAPWVPLRLRRLTAPMTPFHPRG